MEFGAYVQTVIRLLRQYGKIRDRTVFSTLAQIVALQCARKIKTKCTHLLARYFAEKAPFEKWQPDERSPVDITFKSHKHSRDMWEFCIMQQKYNGEFEATDQAQTYRVRGAGLRVFRDAILLALEQILCQVNERDSRLAMTIMKLHFILGDIPRAFWDDTGLVGALNGKMFILNRHQLWD